MRFAVCACLLVGLLLACGSATPCQSCPPIEGSYVMSWKTGAPSDCPVAGPQPATLTFSRSGSTVRTNVSDQELVGTLYDTFDFSLNAGTGTYAMRGRVITLNPSTDGGVRITGTLTTRASTDAGAFCQGDDTFTGDQL